MHKTQIIWMAWPMKIWFLGCSMVQNTSSVLLRTPVMSLDVTVMMKRAENYLNREDKVHSYSDVNEREPKGYLYQP